MRSTDKSKEKLRGETKFIRSPSGDIMMRNRWLDVASSALRTAFDHFITHKSEKNS